MNDVNICVCKKYYSGNILKRIFDIYTDNFEKYIRIPKNVIKNRLKNNIYELNIIKKNKDIIGFSFVVIFKKYNFIFIDYIAIAKEFHGRGYGKLLFNHIFNHYISQNNIGTSLILECENSLLNMYKKWGCNKIPILYDLNNLELNLMIKSNSNSNSDVYYAIKNELLNLNERYLGKKILVQTSSINYDSKFMENINLYIHSLLRDVYCTSRIWKKYVI